MNDQNQNQNPPSPQPFKVRAWHVVSVVLSTLLAGIIYLLGGPAIPPFEAPPDDNKPVQAFGWVAPEPAQVEAFKATLKFPTFAATPAFAAQAAADPEEIYLWKSFQKIDSGVILDAMNQGGVGSCVGFGNAYAAETSLAVSIASWDPVRGPPPGFKRISREAVYAGSRVQIGKRQLGRSDGSTGIWAGQYLKQFGITAMERQTVGGILFDIGSYSETRCREWGFSGVPAPLAEQAKKFPVSGITQVTDTAQLRKCLANGWAVAVCSRQGFGSGVPLKVDADGFARPQGIWGHCMCINGASQTTINGKKRPGFHFQNSWGSKSVSGTVGAGDPPPGGFWVDEVIVAGMLREGDSWALSDVAGFEPRPIDGFDWFAQTHPGKPEPRAVALER